MNRSSENSPTIKLEHNSDNSDKLKIEAASINTATIELGKLKTRTDEQSDLFIKKMVKI